MRCIQNEIIFDLFLGVGYNNISHLKKKSAGYFIACTFLMMRLHNNRVCENQTIYNTHSILIHCSLIKRKRWKKFHWIHNSTRLINPSPCLWFNLLCVYCVCTLCVYLLHNFHSKSCYRRKRESQMKTRVGGCLGVCRMSTKITRVEKKWTIVMDDFIFCSS